MNDKKEANKPVVDPYPFLSEFLFDILAQLPPDLEMQTKNLQHGLTLLENYLKRLRDLIHTLQSNEERLQEIVDFLKNIGYSFGDSAMRSTVMIPVVNKLRELSQAGELDIGFGEEEWSDDFSRQ